MEQIPTVAPLPLRSSVPPEALVLPEFSPSYADRWRQAAMHVGSVAAGIAVAAELSPLTNEGVRLGALTAMQAATHNSYLATSGYAGLTFAIEAVGAVSAAYLIHQPIGTKALAKVDSLLGRASQRPESVARDALTSFVLGSAVATVGAHRRNPDRTFGDDVRYGLKSAAGVTAMTTPIGFALAEGASAAGVEKFGIGLLAVYAVAAVGGVARRIWKRYTYVGRHRSDP
jgi:hypothetical protein